MTFFDDAYRGGTPPWDIGREQGAFRRIMDNNSLQGPILDIGCGTGSNSLFFAEHGFSVVGIDTSLNAITKATEKAKTKNLDSKTEFLTYNLFNLKNLGKSFNTIIDCGVFHMFGPHDRKAYEENIRKILNKNGQIFLLAFSYLEPLGIGPSQRLTKENYQEIFKDNWKIESFTDDYFETNMRNEHAKGLVTRIRRV